MALAPGTKLGPYEILALLGAGGMGEVYRARDTRLHREVAVKVSAERFSERFEREARTVAALNHPHICTLYDVGPNYLVMELVDGPTLADRLSRNPMPVEEALPAARQIAEALEVAHAKGVIHRDLKPANVKFTPEGQIKVLDFGLAKVTETAGGPSGDPANSPTLTIQGTQAGMILGTAAYMAPEQARGAIVDKRADIWAFGCVLYEMLTGVRLFRGGSITDILAAVVRAEPDWSALPAATPTSLRRLLRRCLEKDRKRRLPDIGVALLELDDAATESSAPSAPPVAPSRRNALRWGGAAIGVAAAAGAGALWQRWRTPPAEVWTGVLLGGPAHAYSPRLSPDGQLLAFLAFIDDLPQLGVMRLDGRSWTMLTSDRSSGYIATMAWARDGSQIYFDRYWGNPRGVYSVPPLGGGPRLLLEDAFGPESLPDGSLLVAKLTDRGDHQLFHYWPGSGKTKGLMAFIPGTDISPILRAFPDGKEIVYYGTSPDGRNQDPRMYIMDLASQRLRELAPGLDLAPNNTWAPLAVAPDGRSVFVIAKLEDSRLLMSVPRGGGSGRRTLISFPRSAVPAYIDAAPDGSLYLDPSTNIDLVLLFSVTGGAPEETTTSAGTFLYPAANGDLLATAVSGGKNHLVVLHSGGGSRALLETSEESGGQPRRSPAAAWRSCSAPETIKILPSRRCAVGRCCTGTRPLPLPWSALRTATPCSMLPPGTSGRSRFPAARPGGSPRALTPPSKRRAVTSW